MLNEHGYIMTSGKMVLLDKLLPKLRQVSTLIIIIVYVIVIIAVVIVTKFVLLLLS